MKYLLMSLVTIPVLVSGREVLAQEMQGTTASANVSAIVTGKKTFPDGSEYTGGLLNGKRHGSGTMLWRDGDSYSGEFQHDQKHGNGRYGFADGSFLQGQWQKNQFTGLGVAVFKDGTRYEGEWLNGEKHGYGRITLASGKTYTGEFRKDKLEGWGRAVQPDGSRTDAKWTKDAPDGVAVFVWPNGAIDDQVLRAGFIRSEVRRQPGALPAKPVQAVSEQVEKAVQAALTASKRATERANNAQAIAQSVNPAIPPVAVFQAVPPVIVATSNTVPAPPQVVAARAAVVQPVTAPAPKPVAQTEINGKKVFGDEVGKAQQGVYEGALVNGVRQGYGVMAFSDGRRYEGEWRNDQFNGYGELIRANGTPVYVGEWKNGQYHGKGRATYGPKGSVEWREGDWTYGQPSGRSFWRQRIDGLEVLEIYNSEGDRVSEQVVTPAQRQGNNSSILAAAATALAQMRQKASVPDIVAAQQRGIAMAQQAQPRPVIPSPQQVHNNTAPNTGRVAVPETNVLPTVKPVPPAAKPATNIPVNTIPQPVGSAAPVTAGNSQAVVHEPGSGNGAPDFVQDFNNRAVALKVLPANSASVLPAAKSQVSTGNAPSTANTVPAHVKGKDCQLPDGRNAPGNTAGWFDCEYEYKIVTVEGKWTGCESSRELALRWAQRGLESNGIEACWGLGTGWNAVDTDKKMFQFPGYEQTPVCKDGKSWKAEITQAMAICRKHR